MRKNLSYLAAFIITLSAVVGQAQPAWQDQLDATINKRLPAAEVGMLVMDAQTGKILYSHNSDKTMIPASTVKLFTATAGLASLGPDFRYSTTVSVNQEQVMHGVLNGNLYIEFSGDPSLTTSELAQLMKDVREDGIERINGRVVVDDHRFQQPDHAPGWTSDSLYWAYSAPITAVILNQNTVQLKFVPSRTVGNPVAVIPGKNVEFMGLQHSISTVTYQQALHNCSLNLRINENNVIELSGCWPMGAEGWRSFSIQNPSLFATRLIASDLRAAGVTLNGPVVIGYQPNGLKVIAEHDSAKLQDLLKTMLKESDNVYAESLLKTLGYVRSGRGTFLEGVNAVKAEDGAIADINFYEAALFDGSGQSRYDLLMPHQEAQLLYGVYHNPKLFSVLWNDLPVSGQDGTLHWRMMSQAMKGRVRAKTGSMAGVSALSGYVRTGSGRELIVSIMMNNFVGKLHQARSVQDTLCEELVHAM